MRQTDPYPFAAPHTKILEYSRWRRRIGLLACATLTLAQGACVVEPTGQPLASSSAAITYNVSPAFSDGDPVGGTRAVVAAGRDYLALTNAGAFQFFARGASSSGSINTANPAPVVPQTSSLGVLFANQIQTINARTVWLNDLYGSTVPTASQVPPCNEPDAGYLGNPTPGVTYPVPNNGCVNSGGIYDGDTVYDEYSGHMFIMTKLRRSVWTCTAGGAGAPNLTQTEIGWYDGNRLSNNGNGDPCTFTPGNATYVQKLDTRYIVVAVSQCDTNGHDCENPAHGFRTYALTEEPGDWAQINITRGLLMVNYHDTSNTNYGLSPAGDIYGFSVNDLINGNIPSFLPTPGFRFTANSFAATQGKHPDNTLTPTPNLVNSYPIMFTKMHAPTSADFPTLVTMFGSDVWVFNIEPTASSYVAAAQQSPLSPALWDLSPWMSSLALTNAVTTPLPPWVHQQFTQHAVWSSGSNAHGWPGSLYWHFTGTSSGPGGVSAFRWPMRSAPLSSTTKTFPQITTDPAQDFVEWDESPNDTIDGYTYPIVEHSDMTGDTLLMFEEFQQITAPDLSLNSRVTPKYALAGPPDTSLTPALSVATPSNFGSFLPSVTFTQDILSNVTDPLHPQILFTNVASEPVQYYVTAVPMPDPVLQPAIAAVPASLSLTPGAVGTVNVYFTEVPLPQNITITAPVCTVGGDLGTVPTIQSGLTAVTVTLTAPSSTGTYAEGISCSNGVNVVVPVIVSAPPPPPPPPPACMRTHTCPKIP